MLKLKDVPVVETQQEAFDRFQNDLPSIVNTNKGQFLFITRNLTGEDYLSLISEAKQNNINLITVQKIEQLIQKAQQLQETTKIDTKEIKNLVDQQNQAVLKTKQTVKKHRQKHELKGLIASVAIGSIVLLTAGILIANLNKKVNDDTELKVEQVEKQTENVLSKEETENLIKNTQTDEKKQPTTVDEVLEQIEDYANQINTPYDINYEELPGGYVLTQITYNPNSEDESDTWTVPVLTRIREEAASDSPEAQALTQKFKDALPNVSNIIQVKEPDKTTIETFERDGIYYTVFSHDNKPYAYIYTQDDRSTSVITEYYIMEISALEEIQE